MSLKGKGVSPFKIPPTTGTTLAGKLKANEAVKLSDIVLQELDPHRTIECVTFQVFDAPCRYDAIIGRNVLTKLGIILDFKNKTIEWDEKLTSMVMVPLPPQLQCNDDAFRSDTIGKVDDSGYHSKTIRESNYGKVDVGEVVNACSHLSSSQKRDLKRVLQKFETLFDGVLKVYPDEKISFGFGPDCETALCAHISDTTNAVGGLQERTRSTGTRRCALKDKAIRVDCRIFHYSKERWKRSLDFGLSRFEQGDSAQNLSNPSYCGYPFSAHGLQVSHET